MQRYLVFFSYIGTRFKGAQAQLPPNVTPRVPGCSRLGDFEDRTTVQGLFNVALKRFKALNTPVLLLSSRTDTGVHALCSSGHFDMLHPRHEKGASFQPHFLVNGLNRYFDKATAEISVHRVLPVPDAFHSRYSAAGRAYLYRLGVVRSHAWPEGGDGNTVKALTPISERYRSFIVGGEFSMPRLRECAALLSGEHDFRAFMGSRKGLHPELRTRRDLEIEVTPGATISDTPDIEFWDIHFRSQGFLFRQVRRTVGVLVACARGRMTLDDVRHLLDQPDKRSWNPAAATSPPHGLYLSRVTYHPDQTESRVTLGPDQTDSHVTLGPDQTESRVTLGPDQTDGQESEVTDETDTGAATGAVPEATELQKGRHEELVVEHAGCDEPLGRDHLEETRGSSVQDGGDAKRTRG